MLKMVASRKTDGAVIPTLASVSPLFAKLVVRQGRLADRLAAAVQEQREIFEDEGRKIPNAPRAADGDRKKRIAALVDGGQVEPKPVEIDNSPGKRFADLSQEIEDLKLAMPVVAAQLRLERLKASATICEIIKDQHRALVRAMAEPLAEFHQAALAYVEFAEKLNRDNVAWSELGGSFARFSGDPRDKSSALGQWFRDAVSDGHLSKGDVPEVFK